MRDTEPGRRALIIPLAGFAATVVAIVAVPLVMVSPDHRSHHFGARVAWAVLLAALVWGWFAGLVSPMVAGRGTQRRGNGIVGSIGLTVLAYAAVSFSAMMVRSGLGESGAADRIHLAVQVVGAVTAVVICLMLWFAQLGAREGTEPVAGNWLSPPALCDLLRVEEERLGGPSCSDATREARALCDSIKRLREKLSYSLPDTPVLASNADYAVLQLGVADLVSRVSLVTPAAADSAVTMADLGARADALLRKAGQVASALRRS